jgi:hypothetical protein
VTARTSRTFIAIDRLVDDPIHSAQDQVHERIPMQCFIYDPGVMWVLCQGRVNFTPGCYLLSDVGGPSKRYMRQGDEGCSIETAM